MSDDTPATTGKKPAPKAFDIGGIGKGANWRGLMFSVLAKTGDQTAYPYAYVQKIDFNRSGLIVIDLASESVKIHGRNLGELYYGLVDHHIREIVEGDPRHQPPPEGEAFIEKIEVVPLAE